MEIYEFAQIGTIVAVVVIVLARCRPTTNHTLLHCHRQTEPCRRGERVWESLEISRLLAMQHNTRQTPRNEPLSWALLERNKAAVSVRFETNEFLSFFFSFRHTNCTACTYQMKANYNEKFAQL